uniref:Uncharacterized protein n=1 Tax=Anguilla anguilla TaxID=7936 RepID=A0A0E9PQN3_ANGAN
MIGETQGVLTNTLFFKMQIHWQQIHNILNHEI